ncbi:MAG: hypothetical protein M3P49_09640, partial [Actinomycetota bacterium]|nr:hypothetical protein [Actinomycetota bacterium]
DEEEADAEGDLAERVRNRQHGVIGGGGNSPTDPNEPIVNYRKRPAEDVHAALSKYGLRPRSAAGVRPPTQ